MAKERQRRLMQDALDNMLDAEARQVLFDQLEDAPAEAEVFNRLKQVDRLLKTAPMEPAPERLALRIMARLAEGLQAQPLSQTAGMALALALALMALVMMPLLAAVGWLILSHITDAGALSTLLMSLSSLLIYMVNALEGLVDFARQMMAENPQTPVAAVALIPLALAWLAKLTSPKTSASGDDVN
jgi:hypothetical protein